MIRSQMFCIDRRLIGADANLVCDGSSSYAWSRDVPFGAWHLSGSCKVPPALCLDTAARLLGRTFETSPGKRFERAVATVAPGLPLDHVPWASVMPRRDHATFVGMLVNSARGSMDEITLDYLASTWTVGSGSLERLVRARIDRKLHEILTVADGTNDSVRSALASFVPSADGFAEPVRYGRLSTATGRLTVESGPQILTLRKDLRRILVSRRGVNGAIVALDFSALEAWIVLRTVGGIEPDSTDLYDAISRELGGRASRSAIKTCVLSLLFGAGRRSTAERLGTDGPEVDALIDLVSCRFGFAALGSALARLREEKGMLRNAFGRPLLMEGHDSPSGALLVSHFAQSTGVDVALMGFDSIQRQLAELVPSAKSLFVLHDALFLDVPVRELRRLEALKTVSIAGFEAPFPVRLEIVRCDA